MVGVKFIGFDKIPSVSKPGDKLLSFGVFWELFGFGGVFFHFLLPLPSGNLSHIPLYLYLRDKVGNRGLQVSVLIPEVFDFLCCYLKLYRPYRSENNL